MDDKALIVFIKNPALGKVKTRLARTVGDVAALDIYRELTQITRQNAEILRGVSCYVFYSDFIDTDDDWHNTVFKKQVQSGTDLGERMANAFDWVLKTHRRACIIGSDCPTLTADLIEQGFQELTTHDFVVGPSTDGGYYLLGMNVSHFGGSKTDMGTTAKFLFDNMAWSTDRVLGDTLERISDIGKTVFLLPSLTDVDEEKDWLAYLASQNI